MRGLMPATIKNAPKETVSHFLFFIIPSLLNLCGPAL
jgi:hypothetical protein